MLDITSSGKRVSNNDSGKNERLLVVSVGIGRDGCKIVPPVNEIVIGHLLRSDYFIFPLALRAVCYVKNDKNLNYENYYLKSFDSFKDAVAFDSF